MSHAEKLDQLANAEEHLRRAVIESYERAVDLRSDRVLTLYDEYRERVLPVLETQSSLRGAPGAASLVESLRGINELRERGRAAKGLSQWDATWESGVENFITAFKRLKDLEATLEQHLARAKQSREVRRTRVLHFVGIVLAAFLFLLIAVQISGLTAGRSGGCRRR